MPASKPYHHGNLRNALIRASLALIRQEGPHGFTLREVARRAGVSHTAPYRHFRDKDDLLAAIVEEGFKRLAASMRAAATKVREPFRRLQSAGIAYVEFALDQPEHFVVMFSAVLDKELHPSAKAAAESAFQELLGLVAECRIAALDPLTAARIAWSHVHGIAELAVRRQFGFGTRKEILDFASAATGALLAGMKSG